MGPENPFVCKDFVFWASLNMNHQTLKKPVSWAMNLTIFSSKCLNSDLNSTFWHDFLDKLSNFGFDFDVDNFLPIKMFWRILEMTKFFLISNYYLNYFGPVGIPMISAHLKCPFWFVGYYFEYLENILDSIQFCDIAISLFFFFFFIKTF